MAEKNLTLKFGATGMPSVIANFAAMRQQARMTTQNFSMMNMAAGRMTGLLASATTFSAASSGFNKISAGALNATTAVTGLAMAFTKVKSVSAGLLGAGFAGAAILGGGLFGMFKARTKEASARLGVGESNIRITEAIKESVRELQEAGKITDEQAGGFLERVNAAFRELDNLQIAEKLRGIAREIANLVPLGDVFKINLRDIDARIEENKYLAEKFEFEKRSTTELRQQLDILANIVEERRALVTGALNAGFIAQSDAAKEELKAKKELLEIERQRKALAATEINSNWRMTDAQKYGALKGAGQTPDGPDPNSTPDQMTATYINLQNQIGTMAQIIARGFDSTVMGAIGQVANGIRGLLALTMTWGDALRNIGVGIFNEIINSIARMVAEYIVAHVIMGGVLKGFHMLSRLLGWETTTEQIAQESAKAPSLAMNAATASVGSYGASAVVGMALAVAALGAIIAYASGAFKEGGYTGNHGVNDVAGVVHGREFVFSAPAVDRIGLSNLEAMHSGEQPSGMNMKAVFVWSQRELADMVANSPQNEQVIVSTMGRNAHKFRS